MLRVPTEASYGHDVRPTYTSCNIMFAVPSSMTVNPDKTRTLPLWPPMLPVHGKTRQHCSCAPRGHKKWFWRFSETFFVSATNVACVAKRVNIWEIWPCQQLYCRHNVSSFCLLPIRYATSWKKVPASIMSPQSHALHSVRSAAAQALGKPLFRVTGS